MKCCLKQELTHNSTMHFSHHYFLISFLYEAHADDLVQNYITFQYKYGHTSCLGGVVVSVLATGP
jgi:hypothetical protein